MTEHTIVIEDGVMRFVYADELKPLLDTGDAHIKRVSHVEPDDTRPGWWTADMGPLDGPVLGPYNTREAALAAERDWLREHKGL